MALRRRVEPHFRATVTARTREQGGRSHAIDWGYRPLLVFQADPTNYYGTLLATEGSADGWAIAPGETKQIDFYIWAREAASQILPRLTIGSRFTMNEGSHLMADCTITHVYRIGD
jgi:hypothetical protein